MRTFLAKTLLLLLLVPQLLEAKEPLPSAEFTAFWKEFQSAVAKNDPEAIIALSDLRQF